MTLDEIFELRRQGRIEEAYEEARAVYATDKSHEASMAMFWSAVDMLRKQGSEGSSEEAEKIFKALKRLVETVEDESGLMNDVLNRCRTQIGKDTTRDNQLENDSEHRQMGVWGEEVAVAYLRDKGYAILERDWHSGHKDIDIIARQGDCIVFLEVKTRRNTEFAQPQQAVNWKKQKNILLSINHFIHYHKIDSRWRFDVITVVGELGSSNPTINHIEDFALARW